MIIIEGLLGITSYFPSIQSASSMRDIRGQITMHFRAVVSLLLAGTAVAMPASAIFSRQEATCSTPTDFPAVNERQLPDPWKMASGKSVSSAADWTCRQAEMSKALQQYVLGDYPPPPDSVTATATATGLNIQIKVGSNTRAISVAITKPTNPGASGGPAIIGIGGISIPVPTGIGRINFGNDACASQAGSQSHGTGWFFDLHGRSHSAGATTAWAWCVGRIIDALEQLGPAVTGINTARLGVSGCSRNGKGAFIVGALEKRIALTIPQESGSGGAACWRISDSEKAKGKNIQTASQIVTENAWFSPRFNSFTSRTTTIPADHHFLAAMVAPRGLFVIENDIDWLGPVSTTACMKAGRAIYQALGVGPSMGFSLVGGHQHCQFPSATTANLNSYINRFLLGTGQTNNVETSSATVNMAEWTSSWSTAPQITLTSPARV
ncbi:uncharacterized protein PgNI_09667 [Pyricularia grisea]|uniref:(4-O-methyl)-D-glucuronate--lignin esterase n=1 Tax=Pyricularia grisea TaxID=148305 RepID=A0A6P8ASV9_PYRGI|nr:uncharacterized protein PgNI_09667 [Pyricularia grisea]TLD05211.1 hypothetical protein PgNI_09667 [Pyricularia grisea]